MSKENIEYAPNTFMVTKDPITHKELCIVANVNNIGSRTMTIIDWDEMTETIKEKFLEKLN